MNLANIPAVVSKYEALVSRAESESKNLSEKLVNLREYTIIITDVQALFDTLLIKSRKDIQEKISSVVTTALQSILDLTAIHMKVVFDFKRSQSECTIVVNYDGVEGELQDTFGGGIEDIVGTVLKLVFAQLLGVQGPIWIDEPGKWIDSESSIRFAEFLKQLSKTFKRQLFLVTHKSDIKDSADNLIGVFQENGVSYVVSDTS